MCPRRFQNGNTRISVRDETSVPKYPIGSQYKLKVAFLFVMICVGIGVGGIIIGAYALSRKGERPADFGRK